MLRVRFKAKTKWIVSCGARRSGSTLQHQLAAEIVTRNGGFILGWTTWQNFDKMFREYDGKYPYVIVKCHVHMPGKSPACRKIWKQGLGYGLFVHRNMFDTMVSLLRLNRLHGIPDSVVLSDVEGTISESLAWLETDNVLVTAYDDIMTEDGKARECARIARHIGVDISEEECVEIAKDHSLKVQKARLPVKGVGPHGLWAGHIDTGGTGGWREKLTTEQIEFCRRKSEVLHKLVGYKF